MYYIGLQDFAHLFSFVVNLSSCLGYKVFNKTTTPLILLKHCKVNWIFFATCYLVIQLKNPFKHASILLWTCKNCICINNKKLIDQRICWNRDCIVGAAAVHDLRQMHFIYTTIICPYVVLTNVNLRHTFHGWPWLDLFSFVSLQATFQ